MQVAVPNTCPSFKSWRSASLIRRYGELVLADDAFGIDPKQHVDAVPGPLGDLGGKDAAVEPRGQACMAQIVRGGGPGERLALLA